jgi:hypothetical protein
MVSFQLDSREVLRVSNVLWFYISGGVYSHSLRLKRSDTIYCFNMDTCHLCLKDLTSYRQWFLELERETYIG